MTETLGLVVLEAMASGLPVIAAPEGGVRDHLRDGLNGVTYEAGDAAAMARAMVLLVNEWELTGRLARNARRTAEALSWERELDRLDASYREVCAGEVAPASGHGVGEDAGDRGAAAALALGVHPAAVRLDQVLHDREAEAGAALLAGARRVGPVEPLEDARQVIAGDPAPRCPGRRARRRRSIRRLRQVMRPPAGV